MVGVDGRRAEVLLASSGGSGYISARPHGSPLLLPLDLLVIP